VFVCKETKREAVKRALKDFFGEQIIGGIFQLESTSLT